MAEKSSNDASREEMEDFQHSMLENAKQAGQYLRITRDGDNISEFTLGWFVYDVLVELSSRDDALYEKFNKNNKDIADYLKTSFHDRPLAEIADLDKLAKQGHPTLRLSARYALETLRHIPNPAETQDIQLRDRRELASALATLQDLLEKSAGEVTSLQP